MNLIVFSYQEKCKWSHWIYYQVLMFFEAKTQHKNYSNSHESQGDCEERNKSSFTQFLINWNENELGTRSEECRKREKRNEKIKKFQLIAIAMDQVEIRRKWTLISFCGRLKMIFGHGLGQLNWFELFWFIHEFSFDQSSFTRETKKQI